ncbi:MAG: hypothetical protein ACOCZ7_04060 [Armatimonadota bacterium]
MLKTLTLTVAIVSLLCATTVCAQDTARGRLNNFVVELANIDLQGNDAPDGFTGTIEEPGWLFVELRGEGAATVTLASGDEETVILDAPGEAMRHVDAGDVSIEIERGDGANLEALIVRRVPEIMMYMYEGQHDSDPQGWITHSWEFLEEAILHSTNLIVSQEFEEYVPFAEAWQDKGGRWLANYSMRPFRDEEMDPAEYWAEILGGTTWTGSIHDEVVAGDTEYFERWADGLARFSAMPEREGKIVYLFCGGSSAIGDPTLLDYYVPTEEAAVHGEQSIHAAPQTDANVTARQMSLSMEPGEQYTISAHMRTEDCVPATYSGVFIIDEGWHALYGRLRPAEGTSDWTRYEATFTPRESSNGLYQILLVGPASGGLWIDAVQVERGAEASEFTIGEPNLVVNPSFEDGLTRWMRDSHEGNPLREVVVEHDHAFAPELYLHEQSTEERAQSIIESRLEILPRAWSRHYEGVAPQTLIVLSIGDCALRYSNDHRPDVNYKVLLDMQMHALAAGDSATDLRGVGFWSAHYGSPEAIRWYGALFRHYCIEGSTERLTNDPYLLDHLTNPGFEAGLEGWETEGSVEPFAVADLPERGGTGRYSGVPEGETVIRTVRAEGGAANSFGQPIRNLEPGRAYSVKLYCTDREYSDRLIPADVSIEGGEVLPEYTWDHVWRIKNTRWTMHRRVFRATAEEGGVTISDAAPGEVYWDFVQVEPFFEG